MRCLIINADDVGFSSAINAAVRECYAAGVITSVSVMACGRYFSGACTMLHRIQKPEVGVHLTLTGSLSPVTKAIRQVKTLLGGDGTFHKNYWNFLVRYYQKKIDREEIYLELSNQIKMVQGSGLKITHLDSHEHVHMFPEVLDVVLELASEFNVPYMRLPIETAGVIKKQFSVKDLLRHVGLKLFALRAKKVFEQKKIKCNNVFLGHFHSGRVNDDILTFMAKNLTDGISELAVHPAIESEKLLKDSPWHKNSVIELDVLLNGKWKKCLDSEEIKLISPGCVQ